MHRKLPKIRKLSAKIKRKFVYVLRFTNRSLAVLYNVLCNSDRFTELYRYTEKREREIEKQKQRTFESTAKSFFHLRLC
jgi:hypothetical protein